MLHKENVLTLLDRLKLSGQVGTIRGREKPLAAANGLVVCIQDAHANPGVQRNIAAIVDALITDYGFRHIYTEGTWGPIDSSVIKLFPDRDIKKKACDYLLDKGELTGQEYAVVMRPELEIVFSGVDDERLYIENKKAGAELATVKDRALDLLTNFIEVLLTSCEPVLSRDCLDFAKIVRAYDKGKSNQQDYLSQLHWYAKVTGIREGGVVQNPIKRDGMADQAGAGEMGESESAEGELRQEIFAKLCITDLDRRFLELFTTTELMTSAFQARLTAQRARRFLGFAGEDVHAAFEQDVAYIDHYVSLCAPAKGSGLSECCSQLGYLWDAWRVPDAFYRTAKGRSHIMAHKTSQEMAHEGTDRAVLVVGGFHGFHCCRDLLKKYGKACAVVYPVVESLDAPNYWRYISGNLLTTEEILADAAAEKSGSGSGS
jgi:hypothetical protein